MLIDMGTEQIGKRIRNDIETLPQDQRTFDLLLITHADRDHIGGVLTCLAESDPIPGLEIDDVWFNGFQHLSGGIIGAGLEPMGPAQGERLSNWLTGQVWNRAFNGGPIQRLPGEDLPVVALHDGLKLTVLGPTPQRLVELEPTWKDEVAKALEKGTLTNVSPGLESLGPKVPPMLEDVEDLEILAETENTPDGSEANGSSIALLLQYKGRSIVLSGDAFADDLVAGIMAASGNRRMHVDAFKLPHHGSKKNVSKSLVECVDSDSWVFSTDGNRFRHPDPVALARVISYSRIRSPLVSFNVPSKFNGWWDNDDWRGMYDYRTEYGTKEDGLTLEFESD